MCCDGMLLKGVHVLHLIVHSSQPCRSCNSHKISTRLRSLSLHQGRVYTIVHSSVSASCCVHRCCHAPTRQCLVGWAHPHAPLHGRWGRGQSWLLITKGRTFRSWLCWRALYRRQQLQQTGLTYVDLMAISYFLSLASRPYPDLQLLALMLQISMST